MCLVSTRKGSVHLTITDLNLWRHTFCPSSIPMWLS